MPNTLKDRLDALPQTSGFLELQTVSTEHAPWFEAVYCLAAVHRATPEMQFASAIRLLVRPSLALNFAVFIEWPGPIQGYFDSAETRSELDNVLARALDRGVFASLKMAITP
jgi:hypothetical protein